MALGFAYTDGSAPQIQDRLFPAKNATAGAVKFNLVDITCDGSYGAGGYALTAANMGLTQLFHIIPAQGIGGIVWLWDNVNQKIKGWKSAATAVPFTEVAGGDVSSAIIIRCLAIGR